MRFANLVATGDEHQLQRAGWVGGEAAQFMAELPDEILPTGSLR